MRRNFLYFTKEGILTLIIFFLIYIFGIIAHILSVNSGNYVDWDIFWEVYNYDGSPLDISGWLWLPYSRFIFYPFMYFGKEQGWLAFSFILLLAGLETFRIIHKYLRAIACVWLLACSFIMSTDICFGNVNLIIALFIIKSWQNMNKKKPKNIIIAAIMLAFILFKVNTILTLPLFIWALLNPVDLKKNQNTPDNSNQYSINSPKEQEIKLNSSNASTPKSTKPLNSIKIKNDLTILSFFKIRIPKENLKRLLIGLITWLVVVIILNIEVIFNPEELQKLMAMEMPKYYQKELPNILLLLLEAYHLIFLFILGALYLLQYLMENPSKRKKVILEYCIFMVVWIILVRVVYISLFWNVISQRAANIFG
ncbi:MAG: hypothetical protein ACTSRZ_20200 [Promethearchaeota archaeon]